MTQLQTAACEHEPLSYATVESFYDGTRSGTAEQCLKALCESHERLRIERDGAERLSDEERQAVGTVMFHLRMNAATGVLPNPAYYEMMYDRLKRAGFEEMKQ